MMRAPVNSRGFDCGIHASLEAHKSRMQPGKPADQQQLRFSQLIDASDQRRSGDFGGCGDQKTEDRLPVRDKPQGRQFDWKQQQRRRRKHRQRSIRRQADDQDLQLTKDRQASNRRRQPLQIVPQPIFQQHDNRRDQNEWRGQEFL